MTAAHCIWTKVKFPLSKVSVCRVKTETSTEGKLECKHLLRESKQLCKQTGLLTAEGGGYPSGYFTFVSNCVLACMGLSSAVCGKTNQAVCSQNVEVSRRQSLPVCINTRIQ